ncbi:MAG TPA: ABC transporter ATP-binding protein [Nitrospirae bacterium]|nr:bicarbonate transport ATP-binding protein CmpC [bacterium BMS3Abin06]HDH12722.1 ABC transporter ATP-binding protein [Nitrospirota bacterium]HDZ00031.1 ABC transporter ATP-binding protein [Nitrospirota bacterium]
MIEIKNLKKKFFCNGSNKSLFSGFDLVIRKSEKIGLFAPNGSGKSTLLNILAGVDKDFAGTVSIEGKRISYMHQDTNATLAPWFTCEKNILLVRKYHHLGIEKGKALLKRFVNEIEINFSLDQYPFMLSGGQRQIVALLRALIFEPDVLLLDEPFSALDIEKRAAFIEFLTKHFTNNLTVIMCSHRGDEVKSLLDRAVILEHQSETRITMDICRSKFHSKQEFEQIISKIRFKKNGHEI